MVIKRGFSVFWWQFYAARFYSILRGRWKKLRDHFCPSKTLGMNVSFGENDLEVGQDTLCLYSASALKCVE